MVRRPRLIHSMYLCHKPARTSCTSSNPVASGEHGGSEKILQSREFSNELFR